MSNLNVEFKIYLTDDDGRTFETKLRILEKFMARADLAVSNQNKETLVATGKGELSYSRMVEQLTEARFNYTCTTQRLG
jgi:hypothetical protein